MKAAAFGLELIGVLLVVVCLAALATNSESPYMLLYLVAGIALIGVGEAEHARGKNGQSVFAQYGWGKTALTAAWVVPLIVLACVAFAQGS